jgi:hypothetical protein
VKPHDLGDPNERADDAWGLAFSSGTLFGFVLGFGFAGFACWWWAA